MALFDFFKRTEAQPEQRSYLDYALGLNLDSKQVLVTPETALSFSAVYASVRIISETISQLPFNYYKKTKEGRDVFKESPLQFLVHDEPNGYQTKYIFFETLINTLLLYGNSYAYIERDTRGVPIALTLIHPDKVQVKVKNQRLLYEVRDQGIYDASDMIHILDMTLDGFVGRSRISVARDNIALGIAAQKYGKSFFESSAKLSGVLRHPGQLGADAMKNLSNQWHSTDHSGVSGNFKTAVLEEGMEYKPIQLTPNDAQFLATREFSILEIARVMRVPPHMLADLSRATFSNIEHQSIEFVTHTINPLIKKIEQEFNKKLIFDNDKGKTYFEHNVNALLRGDAKGRSEYYAKMFSIGAITQNEIRARENLNNIKGGDSTFVPMNMLNTDKPTEVVKETPKKIEDGKDGNTPV